MTLQQTIKITLSLLALCVHAALGFAAERPTYAAIVQSAVEKHVIAHLDALKAAADPLPVAVGDVCRTGSAAANEALSSQFRKVVVAYAGVDFLRFGPMLETRPSRTTLILAGPARVHEQAAAAHSSE